MAFNTVEMAWSSIEKLATMDLSASMMTVNGLFVPEASPDHEFNTKDPSSSWGDIVKLIGSVIAIEVDDRFRNADPQR